MASAPLHPYAKLGVAGNLVATGVINTQTNSANTFAGHLDINGTATSTFANGIELEGGCFRDQSGTCISAQGDTQIVVCSKRHRRQSQSLRRLCCGWYERPR
ncbi:MAG: hypothetical protein H6782_02525 [Candidatus Nomurabacteria bacterium]|nr:MAG: hypothetical protein H6782_02525 [Candidatus Nomurabacteria bacterium]